MAAERKHLEGIGKYRPPSPSSPFQWNFPLDTASVLRSVIGTEHNAEHRHRRTVSDTAIIEEQPAWLEELLKEPETPPFIGHRRCSSDTVAYLQSNDFAVGDCRASQDFLHCRNAQHTPLRKDSRSVNKKKNASFDKPSKTTVNEDEQNGGGSSMKSDCSSAKNDATKTDSKESKRNKQQMAHRSRVRKLRYIADLERSVQILQVQGAQAFAQLGYLDEHMLLLEMENRALKQRMESLSQEHLTKHFEQTMLEGEIGRLQLVYQQQHPHRQQRQQ